MLVVACLTHWYESILFFAPLPFLGLFVWISGRRHARDDYDGGERPYDDSRFVVSSRVAE